jgi:hypothetical protein
VPVSRAENWSEVDTEPIWHRIDLDQMAGLVDQYARERWKDGRWYRQVNWLRITTAADELLQRNCRDGLVAGRELAEVVAPVERTLSQIDREGLAALLCDPLQISRWQLHDGSHRAAAMRAQGVRFVPGICMRGDVGSGVDASQVYPGSGSALDGLSNSKKPEKRPDLAAGVGVPRGPGGHLVVAVSITSRAASRRYASV